MHGQEVLKEYRNELRSLFDNAESLLIHENKLLDSFSRQLQAFQQLDVNFKQEIIDQGKYIASVMINADEEAVTNLHMELILHQPEYLREELGDEAPVIGELLYPSIQYEKIGDAKTGEISVSKLTSVWWTLQLRKFRLLEKYVETFSEIDVGENSSCSKSNNEDEELIELCMNYGIRNASILPKDVMTVLTFAKRMPNYNVSEIIRAIQEDPNCSKTLREKSNKMEKRIRRVVKYYDKNTGHLRSYSSL